MFFNQSESADGECSGEAASREGYSPDGSDRRDTLAPPESAFDGGEEIVQENSVSSLPGQSGYERELIQSVWEFAEVVSGNDPELWRKDEFGEWIHRLDYGRRTSEFGWEIFDPGIGRHAQGVYAMRPMQWQSYIRQYEAFA